jgi:hypothetical protein
MRPARISINDGDPLDGMISVVEPSSHALGHWECMVGDGVDYDLIGQSVAVRATVGATTLTGTAIVTRIGSSGTEMQGTGPFDVTTA